MVNTPTRPKYMNRMISRQEAVERRGDTFRLRPTVAMALTEDSTSVDNDEIRSNEKLAVILGTEGTGLPKEVIAACDYRVMIPMFHGVDSLNVAAASAISFWELMK